MLPTSARKRVQDMLTALRVIQDAKDDGVSMVGAARALHKISGPRRGFSSAALLRAYRLYVKDGDWRVLVPAYHRPRPISTEGKSARLSRHAAEFLLRGTRNA